MLAASNDFNALSRSLKPAIKSQIVGDIAACVAFGAAGLSCIFGRYMPAELKTLTLVSAAAVATAQAIAHGSEDAVNAAIADDTLRELNLRGFANQISDRQAMERTTAEIQANMELLQSIAQVPKALQPFLLEKYGFGNLVPLLQQGDRPSGPAAIAPTPGVALKSWDTDADITPDYSWIDKVNGFPAVLVFGPQGSGKTTLAKYLVQRRLEAGHEVEILDPHREAGAWEGLPCYGDGMDYRAVDARLVAFDRLTQARYGQYATKKGYKPQPKTIVAEEMTNWADRCDNSETFLKTSLSDNRKIKMHTLFIAHGRELGLLGGGKGTSKMRDNGLLEIQLFSEPGPNGIPQPTGQGKLRWPASKEWESIDIPNLQAFQLTKAESLAESFADESGISGDLEPDDRLDDVADLTNLRLKYQSARTKPDGLELLRWWNESATQKLEPSPQTITGLFQIVELADAEFDEFLSKNLA
jgi:hypothetical protein